MCGIAGVRRFGDTPITGESLILLLCAIEHRGQHATGIALENPDGIHVHKAPIPAWQFTKSDEFLKFLGEHLTEHTRTALLHTRWYTVGSPEINENNHPMWDGETAVIHNGGISNHTHLFNDPKYHRSCETDSDIIRAIISEHGINDKGVRELSKMSGSAAIACVSTKHPDKLLLARSGSPCFVGFSDVGDLMFWASEPQAIIKASKPWHEMRGVWVQDTKANVSITCMPDDTAWIFGTDRFEGHHRFDTCLNYRQPDYSGGRTSYHSKMKTAKTDAKTVETKKTPAVTGHSIHHPHQGAQSNTFPPKDSMILCGACKVDNYAPGDSAWKDLTCHKCKKSLGE